MKLGLILFTVIRFTFFSKRYIKFHDSRLCCWVPSIIRWGFAHIYSVGGVVSDADPQGLVENAVVDDAPQGLAEFSPVGAEPHGSTMEAPTALGGGGGCWRSCWALGISDSVVGLPKSKSNKSSDGFGFGFSSALNGMRDKNDKYKCKLWGTTVGVLTYKSSLDF